jgi:hypothetical protein
MQWLRSLCILGLLSNVAFGADWPALGRDHTRNPVSPEQDPPTD